MKNSPLQFSGHTEIGKWFNVTRDKWDDWHWQCQNSVRSVIELKDILGVITKSSLEEDRAISEVTQTFEMKLTPHTVLNIYRAMNSEDQSGFNALLNAFVPTSAEQSREYDSADAIGEELECSKPAPLVTNFYKNRVLLFVSNMCPSYCRFCFRRRKIGDHVPEAVERGIEPKALSKAMNYIRANSSIKEVIVSGGDPLMLDDKKLLALLQELKDIEHIKVLRIDTKALTTLPQRITTELVEELGKLKPIFIIGNFIHSVELTPEVLAAVMLLTDSGIPVFSHTALLKGINDDPGIISDLCWNLIENRIIPYYLIQFIPTKWTEHFRVPVKKGLEIMRYLNGLLTGIANPTYIIYLPNGAGKVPLFPNYLIEHTSEGYLLENFEAKKVLYKEHIVI